MIHSDVWEKKSWLSLRTLSEWILKFNNSAFHLLNNTNYNGETEQKRQLLIKFSFNVCKKKKKNNYQN